MHHSKSKSLTKPSPFTAALNKKCYQLCLGEKDSMFPCSEGDSPSLQTTNPSRCTKSIYSCTTPAAEDAPLIQGYDYTIQYRPGKEMIISDTLSCLPYPNECAEVQLDLRVHRISIHLFNFSPRESKSRNLKYVANLYWMHLPKLYTRDDLTG